MDASTVLDHTFGTHLHPVFITSTFKHMGDHKVVDSSQRAKSQISKPLLEIILPCDV